MGVTYYLSIAFSRTGDPLDTDALHLDAQYGFAQATNGGAPSQMGSSGSDFRQFETVNLNAGGNNFVVVLLTPDYDLDQASSYFRVSFRPAHDVAPANNLATSPLNPNDTSTLLQGVTFAGLTETASPSGPPYGLPAQAYSTLWQTRAFNFGGGARGTETHFEFTVEITAVYGGSAYYLKVDPEVIIRW